MPTIPVTPELLEDIAETVAVAEQARLSAGALSEILSGCPMEYPVQAGLLLGLIRPMHGYLEQAVNGLQVMHQRIEGGAA